MSLAKKITAKCYNILRKFEICAESAILRFTKISSDNISSNKNTRRIRREIG